MQESRQSPDQPVMLHFSIMDSPTQQSVESSCKNRLMPYQKTDVRANEVAMRVEPSPGAIQV